MGPNDDGQMALWLSPKILLAAEPAQLDPDQFPSGIIGFLWRLHAVLAG
jgi:hypothetical protein